MSRTYKRPLIACKWCGCKVKAGVALLYRGDYFCSVACGPIQARRAKRTKKPNEQKDI